ncbi:hypothetical protein [Stutzerimonas stutzeri]|uniref:hypothetical protein n=1 Tax=Stutzerimonas stutzeri TaxID=316 RepID=UPI0015E41C44|nr:hypothetical protein [Stutzerimonas stutzeri]MBA1280377.1 hypothetical protein [Stutzerimonas stutzeri]
MAPLPKTVGNSVADERQLIWLKMIETHRIDDLAIRRLQRRISETLAKQGIDHSTQALLHHELAYLYGYQRKVGPAVQSLDIARIHGLPPTADSLSRAHIYWMNGKILQSRNIICAIDTHGERQMISTLIGCTASVGMIARALRCIDELGGNARPEDRNIEAAAAILHTAHVDESQITSRLQTAADVIRESVKHPFMAYDIFADDREGILFQFVVDGSVEEIVQLENRVTEALVDVYDGPIDRLFTIGIKPHIFSDNNTSYGPYHASL